MYTVFKKTKHLIRFDLKYFFKLAGKQAILSLKCFKLNCFMNFINIITKKKIHCLITT